MGSPKTQKSNKHFLLFLKGPQQQHSTGGFLWTGFKLNLQPGTSKQAPFKTDRVAQRAKWLFQLTQRLHIFTRSYALQLLAISAAFVPCRDLALSSSCCRTCLATSRSCIRTLRSSFSCSKRLLFFSMLSSWLWRRMDTSFATWEGEKRSVLDDYTVFPAIVITSHKKNQ